MRKKHMDSHATLSTASENPECILDAIRVDNQGSQASSKITGGRVTTEVTAQKPRTLLATLDDVIRCTMIAENMIDDGT